jgi:hypothetical protein
MGPALAPAGEGRLTGETRLRVGLVAYLLVTLGFFMPGSSWSPVSRYCLTRAIVETRSFEITPFAESTGDRARVGDRFYSDKAPVPSLLAVPAYAAFHVVAKTRNRLPAFKAEGTDRAPARRVVVSPAFRTGLYVCSLATAALAGALLGLGIYVLTRRRVDEWSAVLAAISTVIATPVLPYGASFFGHTISAAFLTGAVTLLDPLGPLATTRRAALAGAMLALAAGSEYVVAVPASVVALWALASSERGERLHLAVSLLAGAAVPALVVGAYHTLCFGAPWITGYSHIVHPAFAESQQRGLFGIGLPRLGSLVALLVGRERGLWYLSPVCLMALVAGGFAWRRQRDPALLVAAAAFIVLLTLNAGYFQWDGGWATGPRHLVPAIGLLGIGIGHAFAHPWLRSISAVAAGFSASVLLLTTAVGLEAPPNKDAIFEYLIPAVREGRIARVSGASNLGLALGLGRRESLVPLFGWVLAGLWWLRWLSSRREIEGEHDEPR